MRKAKLLVAAVMMAMGVSASAQLTKDFTGWTRVELSFDAQSWKVKSGSASLESTDKEKGLAFGFMKGISISQKLPIFLDLGGRISWTHSHEDLKVGGWDGGLYNLQYKQVTVGKDTRNYMNIAIPVNAAYKFSFSKVALTPFFGPNFKFTFLAKEKRECTNLDYEEDFISKYNSEYDDNLLKDDDVRVFQFGLNVGLGVTLKSKFYFGYTFQPDLSSFEKYGDWKLKAKNNYITVGYNF